MAKCYDNFTREELIELLNKQDKELALKKYGLVWDSEKEPEKVVLDCEKNLPILKRISSNEIKTDSSDYNILIEGDNFHALSVLNYTHENSIDVIYIDPPYNTGSKDDFRYNDSYVDKEDGYRHSKWLNFMEKRLNLAKSLLKDTGVIFISIGEFELGNLNILCNSIFGCDNFLSIIARISKTASDKGSYFAPSCDYIVCYAKNKNNIDTSNFYDEVDEDLYTKEDEKGKYRDDVAFYQSSLDPLRGCVNQRYFVQCPDGTYVIPPGDVMPDSVHDGAFVRPESKKDKVWRWSYDSYLKNKDLLVFKETKKSPLITEKGERAKYNIYTKSYLETRKKTGIKPRNFLTDKRYLNRRGADYLKTLCIDFPYSKPKELIKHLINILHLNKNSTILDFFAGSGTTAEAIIDINLEQNLNLKFIMCTDNENNICTEVCYPRIEKIIKGYNKNGDGEFIDGLGGNLQYFKTDFIKNSENIEQLKVNLTYKCTEMLCLKENIYNLKEEKEDYKIFESNKKDKYLCVYYNFINDSFKDFLDTLKDLEGQKIIYMFSIDDSINNELFEDIDNYQIKTIPQKILDIYKKIIKENVRG